MVHHYLEDHPDYAQQAIDSVGHYLAGYDQMMSVKYPSERDLMKAQMRAQLAEEEERRQERRKFNQALLDSEAAVPEYVQKRRGVSSDHAERMSRYRLTTSLGSLGRRPESTEAAAQLPPQTGRQTARSPSAASRVPPSTSKYQQG